MSAAPETGRTERIGRPARIGRPVRIWVWALALLPAVLGTLLGLVFLLGGDGRRLEIGIAMPGVIIGGGIAVTLFAVVALVLLGAHSRRALRRAECAAEAATAAEREHHRRFLARLDHELKNPITAIRATAVTAQSGAVAADAWPTVDAQATKLSGLVRDLRKLAELETRPLDRERIDLEQLLIEAIGALGQQDPDAAARTTLTVTRVPWPVPPVEVDADLLAVAIDNVLGNAAKYSSVGPIEVRLREDAGWAVIEVADAGRGVPEDDLPHVFDELARAGNARDVAGSGIGLTLVATVLRRHGGDVSFRSLQGSGSLVALRVPLARG